MPGNGWREPGALLPLRWGRYRARYCAGVALIFCGGLVVQTSSVYALQLMLLGVVLHLAGWLIVPGKGWRRGVVILPSLAVMVVILNGAGAMAALVIPLAGWLLVRQRPAWSYSVLIIPVLGAYAMSQFFAQYGSGALVLLIGSVALAASAWLARFIASSVSVSGKPPAIIG